MSNEDKTQKSRPQKRKTAAQRASDANKIMQHAVRSNIRRPSDLRQDQKPEQIVDRPGFPPGWSSKDSGKS